MKQSLKRDLNTLDGMEKKVLMLKDEVVETSVHHFEKARRHVSLLYHNLDLISIDPFQVI